MQSPCIDQSNVAPSWRQNVWQSQHTRLINHDVHQVSLYSKKYIIYTSSPNLHHHSQTSNQSPDMLIVDNVLPSRLFFPPVYQWNGRLSPVTWNLFPPEDVPVFKKQKKETSTFLKHVHVQGNSTMKSALGPKRVEKYNFIVPCSGNAAVWNIRNNHNTKEKTKDMF